MVNGMDSARLNEELEEGEIEDEREPCLQASNKFESSERYCRGNLRLDTNSTKLNYGDGKHRNISKESKEFPDGSFWGPCDLFEKQKHFERKYPWFGNSSKTHHPNSLMKPVPMHVSHKLPSHNHHLRKWEFENLNSNKTVEQSSFDDLLEQYRKIKVQLKTIESKDSNSYKRSEDCNEKVHKPRGIKKSARRRSRPKSKRLSSSNKVKKSSSSTVKEDDEDELELRRIALESAVKLKSSETNNHDKSNGIVVEDILFLSKISTKDNYETVEMDLASESENEIVIESSENAKPDLTQSSSSLKIDDDDEEILRAQLLMSLAKQDSVSEIQDSLAKETVDSLANLKITTGNIGRKVKIDEDTNCVSLPNSGSQSPKQSRIVINLADDSDSDSQDESATSVSQKICDDEISASISAFIQETRKLSATSNNAPNVVNQLSHAQQVEYYQLKAEIAKREEKKPKLTDESILKYKKKLLLKSQLLQLENNARKDRKSFSEDQQRLKVMRSQLHKLKLEQGIAQTKVNSLKAQLLSAEKSCLSVNLRVQKLSNLTNSMQLSLKKKATNVRAINQNCTKLRKEYNLKYPTVVRKRTNSIRSSIKVKKMNENEDSNSNKILEKERLRNMEKDIASKLNELRKKMDEAQNMEKTVKKTNHAERRKSFLELDPSTTPKLVGQLDLPLNKSSDDVSSFETKHQEIIKTLECGNLEFLSKLAYQTFSVLPSHATLSSKNADIMLSSPLCSLKNKPEKIRQSKLTFKPYSSPLVAFRSYRFSPYFKQTVSRLSSNKVCNSLDPFQHLCRYELAGKCNDDECSSQHRKDYEMSVSTTLVDIASFDPSLANLNEKMDFSSYHSELLKFSKQVIGVVGDYSESAKDDYAAILIDFMNRKRTRTAYNFVVLKPRKWKPCTSTSKNSGKKSGSKLEGNKKKEKVEDLEFRYFSSDNQSLLNMEAAALNDSLNVALWIKLAQSHLQNQTNDNCLQRALNALSRGLEFNKYSPQLWLEYLKLYSHLPDGNYQILCEKAVEFAPDYEIWLKYLVTTKEFQKKTEICSKIIKFIHESNDLEPEAKSYLLVEIILYKTRLCLSTGHQSAATSFIKKMLTLNNLNHLSVNDGCFLWICYIHMIEFGSLPTSLFDANDENSLHFNHQKYFLIIWHRHKKLQSSIKNILAHFKTALDQCVRRSKKSFNSILDGLPIYINLMNLELYRGNIDTALKICRKLLDAKNDSEELWSYLIQIKFGCVQLISPDCLPKFTDGKEMISHPYPPNDLCKNFTSHSAEALSTYDEATKVLPDSPMLTHLIVSFCQQNRELCETILVNYSHRAFNSNINSSALAMDIIRKYLNNTDSSITPCRRLYLWLNYCFMLEVCQFSVDNIIDAYQSAVWANQTNKENQKVWCQYINYLLRQYDGTQHSHLEPVLKRCLLSLPIQQHHKVFEGQTWLDFSFHNKIFDLLFKHIDDVTIKTKAYHDSLSNFPSNIVLVNKSFRYFLTNEDLSSGNYLYNYYSSRGVASISFWKMALCFACKNDQPEGVRDVMEKAVKALPYASTLWKDFILYELSLGSSSCIKSVLKSCYSYGLNVDKFLNFLLEQHRRQAVNDQASSMKNM